MIPTHFRFKFKSDADEWGTTTTKFWKIDKIKTCSKGWELSTSLFAWVCITPKTLDRFEFKTEFK